MERLTAAFKAFAGECGDSSRLYQALSLSIANDSELLQIAGRARPGQPVPNLLFAAVHALLLEAPDPSLAVYYRSLTENPLSPTHAFPAFRQYVIARCDQIEAILAERLVQTNEVRRSIYIAPAFARIQREFPQRPLGLIEIGTSAGLNLLWDRFSYEYAGHPPFGDPTSPLRLRSELRGEIIPPMGWSGIDVGSRIGVDLNPLDLSRPEDLFWLRALIWPEHTERLSLLDEAINIQRETPVQLVAGDAVALLPSLVAEIPRESVVGIFHTHVANQLGAEGRAALLDIVAELGRERDLVHLHNNIEPHLHATIFRDGERHDLPLAHTDGHARWVEWLDAS